MLVKRTAAAAVLVAAVVSTTLGATGQAFARPVGAREPASVDASSDGGDPGDPFAPVVSSSGRASTPPNAGGTPCSGAKSVGSTPWSDIETRAASWLTINVRYNEGTCYHNQYGTYRTDCSGFLSLAWGLGDSYTTDSLPSISSSISFSAMVPGDALLEPSQHVMLFHNWVDSDHKTARVWEESRTGSDMQDLQIPLSYFSGHNYHAIHYNRFQAVAAPAPVPAADRPGVSVSADGTVLTYARKGDHEIMVKTLTNGTWSAPVDALGITPGQPRISGDGGSIFFRVGDGRVARTYRSSDGRWHPATIGGAARGNISPNRNGTIAYYSDQGNGRVARAVYNSATGKFSVANFGTQNARGDLTTNATGTSVFYVTPAGRPYQTYDSPSGVHEVALPNTTNVNTVAINADANQTYYPTPDGTVTINSYNGSKWVTTPTGGTSAQSLAVTADGGAVYFPTPSTKFPTNDWHTTGNWNGPAALLTSTTTNRALTTAATAGTGVFEVDTNGNLVDISIKNGTWNGQIIERNATDA